MSDKNIDWIKRMQLLEKALKENGVNNSVCVELEPKISGYELDFSEHDKVFEDKIAKLKSEITSLESHMSRLRERCMDGARRNFDRGNYGCLTILNRNGDLETESEKLKQRIAELESKETKKPINGWICVVAKEINGKEYVKLEDFLRVVNDLQEQNRLEMMGSRYLC